MNPTLLIWTGVTAVFVGFLLVTATSDARARWRAYVEGLDKAFGTPDAIFRNPAEPTSYRTISCPNPSPTTPASRAYVPSKRPPRPTLQLTP